MSVLWIAERRHRDIIIRRVPLASVLVIGREKSALRAVWIAERRRKEAQMLTALLVFARSRGKGMIAKRAVLTAKMEAHQTKIAPLAPALVIGTVKIAQHAPILGQGITAKRAALTAKTVAHQTKIAPLARIATIHGAVRIAQHVRCNKAVAPAE